MATQRPPTGGPSEDVHEALTHFKGLKLCKPQPYFFPDGEEQYLYFLEGTIPVFVRGTQYNIPITIWLRQNHPDSSPIVYVRPGSGMTTVKTPNVDVDGGVRVDYLSEWTSSSELTVLIQILCATFSEQCPVYTSPEPTGPSKLKGQNVDSDPQATFKSSSLDIKKEQALNQDHFKTNTKLFQPPSLALDNDCFSKTGKEALEKPPLLPLDLHQNDRGGEISSAKIFDSSPEGDNDAFEKKLLSSDDEDLWPNQRGISPIQQQTEQIRLGDTLPHPYPDVPQGQSNQPQYVAATTPAPPPVGSASARPQPPRAVAHHEQSRVDLHEFSWDFIDNAVTCDICQESMIEPNLLQCCGNGYLCHKCVKEFRKRAMPCPLCQQQAFKTQVDRNYQSVIQRSRVWCPCKENGCTWSGIFQDAEGHLQECGFHVVNCPNHCINVKVQQRFIKDHLNECPLQPVPCPYAEAGCNELPSRKDIPQHVAFNVQQHLLQVAEKNHAVIQECKEFEKDMKAMYDRIEKRKQNEINDLKGKLSRTKKDISKLEDRIRRANTELQQLHEQQEQSNATLINLLARKGEKLNSLSEAQEVLSNQFRHVPMPTATYAEVPTVFTLDHFSERKANDECWLSPPFYTHTGGYKLRLSLYPNGHAEEHGKSVSIYLHLTRGEFDDYLQWPMPEFHLQVLLKNQRFFVVNLMDKPRSANLRKNFDWDSSTTIAMRCRIEEAGIGPGWGVHRWIPHANLSRYLTNDSLSIQVHRITFLPH